MQSRFAIPDLGLGMGLRSRHYEYILSHNPPVDFFEIISETYLTNQGRPQYFLHEVAERYPILMHGVSLSIGSTDPLNFDYLSKLKALAQRLRVPYVSDHLCWTAVLGKNTHDLLPVPLTEDTLRHVVERIRTVQDYLEVPLALENPSNYLEFRASQMSEAEFMNRMAEQADCALLLDVNNVYVSAYNHGFDAYEYLDLIPPERVVHHHLAGHTNKGTHILDTHSTHVIDEVWRLYNYFDKRSGGRSTMVEWDDDIPAFEVVHEEVLKAGALRDGNRKEARDALVAVQEVVAAG
jgi:uncharacterized protein